MCKSDTGLDGKSDHPLSFNTVKLIKFHAVNSGANVENHQHCVWWTDLKWETQDRFGVALLMYNDIEQ